MSTSKWNSSEEVLRQDVINSVSPAAQARLQLPGLAVYGDIIIVDLDEIQDAHFCCRYILEMVRDKLEPVTNTRLDLDLTADEHYSDEDVVSDVEIFLGSDADKCIYIGQAYAASIVQNNSKLEVKYQFNKSLSLALATKLRQGEKNAGMDGLVLENLLDKAHDNVAEQLATMWLGSLPDVQQPGRGGKDIPEAVQRWHKLWAQLATFSDHPWASWPACWRPGETSFFQNEWTNPDMFGVRDDGSVWAYDWENGKAGALHYADSMEEFAVQFIIYGLSNASHGFFISGDTSLLMQQFDLKELPIHPWLNWFGGGPIRFIGGAGLLGIDMDGELTLRATGVDIINRHQNS